MSDEEHGESSVEDRIVALTAELEEAGVLDKVEKLQEAYGELQSNRREKIGKEVGRLYGRFFLQSPAFNAGLVEGLKDVTAERPEGISPDAVQVTQPMENIAEQLRQWADEVSKDWPE